jgi:hypothetical protein
LIEISHCQEYDDVPVDGIVPPTVSTWLTSSAVSLTVGAAGAVSAVFTVTTPLGAEVVVTGVDAESFSCIS